jgi:hypothetical protein
MPVDFEQDTRPGHPARVECNAPGPFSESESYSTYADDARASCDDCSECHEWSVENDAFRERRWEEGRYKELERLENDSRLKSSGVRYSRHCSVKTLLPRKNGYSTGLRIGPGILSAYRTPILCLIYPSTIWCRLHGSFGVTGLVREVLMPMFSEDVP